MFTNFNNVKKFSNNFVNNNFKKKSVPLDKVVCYRCLNIGHYAGQCCNKKVQDIKHVIDPLKTKIINHLCAFKKLVRLLQKEISHTMPLTKQENLKEYLDTLCTFLQDATHQWADNVMESQKLKEEYEKLKIEIMTGEKSVKSIQNKNIALQLINKKNEKELTELKNKLDYAEKNNKKLQNKVSNKEIITTGYLDNLSKSENYEEEQMQKIFSINPNSLNKSQKGLLGIIRTRIKNQIDGKNLNDSTNSDPLLENYLIERKRREIQKEKTEWSKLEKLNKEKEKEKERILREKRINEERERRKRMEEERLKLEKRKIENIEKFNQKKQDDYDKKEKERKMYLKKKNYQKMKKNEVIGEKRKYGFKKELEEEPEYDEMGMKIVTKEEFSSEEEIE